MGGSRKTNIDEGDCLKGRAWLVCRFKGVGVFKEGGGTQCTLWVGHGYPRK